MTIISTPNMPKSNGHYSQCIEHNGLLYLSGQLPIDQRSKKIPSTIEEQTDLVLKNVETILHEAKSSKKDVKMLINSFKIAPLFLTVCCV